MDRANHFLFGTRGLRNNRIPVRAARRVDVHRCEKGKSSLNARTIFFSRANCVETIVLAVPEGTGYTRILLIQLPAAIFDFTLIINLDKL